MPANSFREVLRTRVRDVVPAAPGVYVWLDADGKPIYVGKSRNLRSRMLSYLHPAQTAADSRVRLLAFAVRGFEYRQTAGELLALLLEDALIKRLQPRFNERQRDYLERCYILLTDDLFPTCLVVDGSTRRGGELFGPFKDRHLAERVLALVQDEFGLRACSDPTPFRRGTRFGTHRCTGPCRGDADVEAYDEVVERTRAFFRGDASWVAAHLSESMDEAAQRLAFERAAELLETRGFVERFARRQAFFRRWREGVVEAHEAQAGLRYRFERGLLAVAETDHGVAVDVPAEALDPPPEPRAVLDRANIVYDFLSRQA